MTARNGFSAVIDKYNSLTVPDQTILQALSALYEPASAAVTASCLAGAGCRESPMRAFSPQNVAVRLARLAKAGVVADSQVESRGQKIRLWRCKPELAEIAMRHAVRDGRFLPIAKAALAGTRGRDWIGEGAGESLARSLRLAFHGGDWKSVQSILFRIRQDDPGRGGALFASVLRQQPDDSWLRATKSGHFALAFQAALEDLLHGLENPEPLDALAAELAEKGKPGFRGEAMIPVLAEMAALRGNARLAAKIAGLADGEETRLMASLAPAILNGGEDAAGLAERAMALRRSRLGARETVFSGSRAVWLALAAMFRGAAGVVDDAPLKRLFAGGGRDNGFSGGLFALRHAFLYMAGESYAARSLPDEPPDGHPLTVLCHALSMLCVDPRRLGPLAAGLEEMAGRAHASGYRWLAEQFRNTAAVASSGRGLPAAELRWPPLAPRFQGDDEWRRNLRALEELAADGAEGVSGQRKRLAWLIGFPSRPDNPYVPFDIQPVEQTLGKDGTWSKGRNVALRRLIQRSKDVSFASDRDSLVFSSLRYIHDELSVGYQFDAAQALHFLVGHPYVYRNDAGGAKLEVVAGEFDLSVCEKDGGCEISLEPPISEFLPAAGAIPDSGREDLPDTLARLETPTRLRVLRLGSRERRLAKVIGDGLAVPACGRDEAIRVLARLSGRVRLHSDIPELAGGAEMTEADPRPRFHIIPQNPGLKVEIWAHPLGDDGPAYRPGEGGRVLAGEVAGRAVRAARNRKREKALAGEAVAACPSLDGRGDSDLSWRLENPGDGLAFLAEVGDLGDRAVPVWPRGGRFRVRRLADLKGMSIRVNGSTEWFGVEGSLRVDENLVVDMGRLLSGLHRAKGGGFIEIGEGEYLALTDELRRQLGDLEALADRRGGDVLLSSLAAPLLEGMEGAGASLEADAEWLRLMARRRDLADFTPEPPGDFGAKLRDYQLNGFRWMARLAEWGAGACLADDMGLGKTIQALAVLALRAGMGPALVVAPTSVCHNWMTETRRFAPGLAIARFGDGDRAGQIAALGPGDVVIASYSLLRGEGELLSGVKWATVVLDEAQAIKNFATKRSRAAMNLDAGFRLITTGTPIENHLGELWNLFRFINPRLLGSWRKFRERFADPIERFRDPGASDRLRRVIRPFILRRTKGQVLESLPPKTEITLAVELGERERAFYEKLRRDAVERLESDGESAETRRFRILAEIMRLRRCCCSPELITGDRGFPSAKQEQFRATLAELVENGHKALVFSQFVDHLSIIRRHLDEAGYSYQYLDGSTPHRTRARAVEDFQAGGSDVFLISLKAGGLGLNLTAADYVIHMDPWWNPAVEVQASDRAHRIGQDRPVTVYRLVAAGTIEEKIVRLHGDKRDLADNLLSGTDRAGSLDIEEIMRLLRDERE